jgi:hypothetical protein
VDEGTWLFHEELLHLVFERRQEVHMSTVAVVLLLLRVLDGLTETGLESLVVSALDTDPLVILLEALDALHLLKLLLEHVLNLGVHAAIVVIDSILPSLPVFAVLAFEDLIQSVEKHGDPKAYQTGLETSVRPSIFKNQSFIFKFVVSMVELWDNPQDPEHLSVKLFLCVGIDDVFEAELARDCDVGEDVTERAAIVLDSLGRLVDEGLQLLIQDVFSLGPQTDQVSEKSEEVDKASDGLN